MACIPAPTPPPTPEPTTTPAPTPAVEQGIIEIRVTDPPPPGVSSAYVTLTKIEVHQASDNVSDNASGWITIISGNSTFNLFEIINEADVLGSENVTAGKYTQIRMEVIEVKGLLSDNTTPYTATVPSGKLRIVRPFNVEPSITTVLTLDFDGDKSLVMTGKEDKVLFKPVIRLLVEHSSPPTTSEEGEGEAKDTTSPVINITGVADGQQYSEPVTPVISVSDDDPNPSVNATLDGNPFTSGTEISDVGEYELVVTAIDASGNEAEVVVSFEIVQE